MDVTQYNAVIAKLVAEQAHGYEVILGEGVCYSTHNFYFAVKTIGGKSMLVATSKTSDTKIYIDIDSIVAVKQRIAPKRASDLAPTPWMNGNPND